MHSNLRSFLDVLRRENDLISVETEVDPYLEVAEIHRRVIAERGPALLFTRVKGSRFPVVTNLFGTEKRIDLAFGKQPEMFLQDLVSLTENVLPPKPREIWRQRSLFGQLFRLRPRHVSTAHAPVTEVVEEPARLTELPVLT